MLGLGIILNQSSTANQQTFNMNAVAGSLTLVYLDGVLQNPSTYTISNSRLIFNQPLVLNRWVQVVSGLGGTFIPQSYVDNALANKIDRVEFNTVSSSKVDKSGSNFLGEVNIQSPINPMNPVTKAMWDTLPAIATPAYVTQMVSGKADKVYVDLAISALRDEILSKVVTTTNNRISVNNLPEITFADDVSFAKFGSIIVSLGKGRWYPIMNGYVKNVIAHLEIASVGGDVRINVLRNGVTIFAGTDKLIVPAGVNQASFSFPYTPTFVKGDYYQVEILQTGTTNPGENLTVQIEYQYTPGGLV